MKKNFLLMAALLMGMAMSVTMTSCDHDDDDDEEQIVNNGGNGSDDGGDSGSGSGSDSGNGGSGNSTSVNGIVNGAIEKGIFTINAEGKQIRVSQGNLQYQPSTGTWRFAENPWDRVGKAANKEMSETYDGWIDMFYWGSGDNPLVVPADDAGFVDWGKNPISNGGNQPNQWRTLSNKELKYIAQHGCMTTRLVQVPLGGYNYCYGLLIFPFNYVLPDGLQLPVAYEDEAYPDCSQEDMLKYQANGAFFIPEAGCICSDEYKSYIIEIDSDAVYWTTTSNGSGYGTLYNIRCSNSQSVPRAVRASVRLVQDL